MSFASKVRSAHKKADMERAQRKAMYGAAMNALSWWEQTNSRADGAINAGIQAAERIATHKITFDEWLKLSPFRWVRKVAFRLNYREAKVQQDVREAYSAYEVWCVSCILGGKKNLSPSEIAKELDLSLERVLVILKQIGDEAKAEMQRKIDAEKVRRVGAIARNPRPYPTPATL